MKTLLFIPVSLCLASVQAKLEPNPASALAMPLVATAGQVCEDARDARDAGCGGAAGMAPEEAVDETRGDEQLGLLHRHLDGMARSLRETEKSVVEMARQRDAAREEAARHREKQAGLAREMAKLRDELQAARSEGAEWKRMASALKDKVNAGALAQAEMQEFRDEMQGAMREFQAMKEDFGKAREELRDPIERTELKKSVAILQASQKSLEKEVEAAIEAKSGMAREVEALKVALRETEGRVKAQEAEMRDVGQLLAKARAEQATALADVDALRKQAAAERDRQIKTGLERDQLRRALDEQSKVARLASDDARESRRRLAALEGQRARTGEELAKLRGHLKQVEAEAVGRERALAEAVKVAEAARGDRDEMAKALAEAESGLGEQDKALESLNAEMRRIRETLKETEGEKRKVDAELKAVRSALEETQEDLALATRAKNGLEQLLLPKNRELRELKVALRRAEEEMARHARREEKPAEVASASED